MSSTQSLLWHAAAALSASVQLAAALRFRLASGRERDGGFSPPLSVLVACKDPAPGLEDSLLSLLRQDYPGEWECLFVVSSREDGAVGAIEAALSRARHPRARLLVTGAVPDRGGAKALNLAVAAGQAAPGSEVLAFADSDLRVGPDWLRRLVAPLSSPETSASTSLMVYRPARLGVSGTLRLLWMAEALPWFEPLGCLCGQSLAIRRAEFEAMGVPELWRRTVSDDLSLAARLRETGRRMRFVASASPLSAADASLSSTIELFNRWTTLFLIYDPRLWALSLGQTALKAGILARFVHRPDEWTLLVLLAAGDAAFMAVILGALKRWQPSVPLWAAVFAPLLPALHALNFAASAFSREIAWAGWSYLYREGGWTAHPDAGRAPAETRRRLLRFAAAFAGGALLGLGFRPGPWGALAWIAFLPLLWACRDESPSDSFAWGGVFGWSASAFGMPWMLESIRRFLGVGAFEAGCWFALLCAAQSLRWAAAAGAARWLARGLEARGWERSSALAVFAAPSLVAAEWAIPIMFPVTMANTQLFHLPLVQSVEPFGTAGLAWLVSAANAALFALLCRPDARRAGAAALVAAAAFGAEAWGRARIASVDAEVASRLAAGRSLRVGVVQSSYEPPYLPPPDRYVPNLPMYERLTRPLLEGEKPGLIVWPEGSYGELLEYSTSGARALPDVPELGGVPVLMNAMGRGADGGVRNVSVLAAPGRALWEVAEKVHLVPFGEYMPLGDALPFLHALSPRTARLPPGAGPVTMSSLGSAKLAPLICFEDMIEGYGRSHAAMGAQLLVNQSSDLPFPPALAHEMHLRHSVLRAIESRRFLVRAVNTGVSAVVDPVGRVLASVPPYREGVLAERVALMDGPSPLHGLGRWSGAAAAALLMLGAAAAAGRKT